MDYIKRNIQNSPFVFLSLIISFHLFLLYVSGYFEIGLMADDYMNFVSAQSSTLLQKFTSTIPYYSHFHLRPVWFLSINFSIFLNDLFFNNSLNSFIFFRIENLILFYILILISAKLIFRISGNLSLTFIYILFCLLFPNLLNSLCWTAGKVDILCCIFILSALTFSYNFLISKNKVSLFIALLFFLFALLTKETAVILPFVTLIFFLRFKSNVDSVRFKILLVSESVILLIYFLYKIFIIGNNPFELVSVYQNPEITNSLSVVLKALISLTIPYDYLSLQYELFNFNLSLIFYLVTLLTVITILIYTLIKNKNVFSIIFILFLFLMCIAPNLIAGYFRPQLVLIPFVIINIFLFLILSDLNFINKHLKVFVSILLFCWTYQSFILINDWKYAYDVSLKDSKQMCETNFNFEDGKTKLIIGLPSRFKQTHMLDYATGHYNYYCEKKFILKNIVTDIIHTGALDKNSIDAELKLNIISDSEFEIKSTGTTQFLLKLDLIEKKFRDKDLEIVFSEYNSFNKPTKANVKLLSAKSDLYLLNNHKFTKLNY